MSAAEKLKTQVARASTGQYGFQPVMDALGVINRALPQIVAVVEAAEMSECPNWVGSAHSANCIERELPREQWCRRCSSLAALDEALP